MTPSILVLKDRTRLGPILIACSCSALSTAIFGVRYYFHFIEPHVCVKGFHLIDGAEGRKDVHQVLFQYLKEAPEFMFYDFACSLSEYSLNRAGNFYRDTRFFHDVRRIFEWILI